MLLAKRKGVFTPFYDWMIQRIACVEVKPVGGLHNNTNENSVFIRHILEKKIGINCWFTWISKYTHASIIALTSALVHLNYEIIAKGPFFRTIVIIIGSERFPTAWFNKRFCNSFKMIIVGKRGTTDAANSFWTSGRAMRTTPDFTAVIFLSFTLLKVGL